MIPFLHLSASAESVTADIIDRMSDAMMSATEKLINFLIRFGIPITLLILLTVAAVRGIRALRRWQISKLRYERYFSDTGVFEADHAELYEKITNPTPFPLLMVDVEAYVYGELELEGYTGLVSGDIQYFISRFNLPPRKTVVRRRRITAKKRGVYELGTASVVVGGEPVYFESRAKLYVYPRFVSVKAQTLPKNALTGDTRSARRLLTDPFSISGIRDMAPGDPFNSINFKATARTGGQRIKVNERDFCSGRIFMIFLNLQQPAEPIPGTRFEQLMEAALSYSASLVRSALRTGYRVGFAANCGGEGVSPICFLPSSRQDTLQSILEEMASARLYDCDMSFSALLSKLLPSVKDADVFMITASLLPEYDAAIKQYKRKNNSVTVMQTGR
ncbi:MAG: DUF58 domain-containing protein [Clostridia bacterium]|nr:DUF58 domain-containing protein [Clostridia bacterium]